jgi:hypothetical protein
MTSAALHFAKQKIPILLSRYDLSYYQEDNCIEYFIADKPTKEPISRSIVFSMNRPSVRINVGRFFPELHVLTDCRYLSAACFYLLAHHFAVMHHIPKLYPICLETRPETYRRFFSKLEDFHFFFEGLKLCETAKVCGRYPQLDIDISMVREKVIDEQEVPFLV